MEQTQLSLDRPTSRSKEPSRPEEPAEIGTSCPADNDSKLDCNSSQVTPKQKQADDCEENFEAENSKVNRLEKRDTKFGVLTFDGSDSTDGTMKMEGKDEDGIIVELKSANSTPSFEEDSISLSQNSDTRPSTSEGEYSSGKDDCDLLMTDVSKSDSVGEADTNSEDRIEEEEWEERNMFNTDEKETTFMDSVVYNPKTETAIEDRILNQDDNNMAQDRKIQREIDADYIDDETSKTASLMPIHFQKKARCSELSATPPKKTQKRKVGSSKLCSQVGEAERGENKCHLVPNGQCKSKDTGRKVDGLTRGDHIVNLDLVGTSKDEEHAEIKGDRVTVRVQDSDCESDTSLLPEENLCCLERFRFVRKHLLTLAMTLSVIFGIILGSSLRSSISPTDQRRIIYLRFPGELFVNILHMLVIPLAWSTLVSNVAAMNARSLRKLGLRSLFYYSITTFIALVTGIILAMTAQPGKFDQLSGTGGPVPRVNPVDAVLDLLRNIFPDNIIVACFKKFTTQQVLNRWPDVWPTSLVGLTGTSEQPHNLTPYPDKNGTNVESGNTSSDKYSTPVTLALLPEAIMQVNKSELYKPIVTHAEGTNFLGLVLAAIVMGAVISSMGQKGRPLHDFFFAFSTVTMKITRIVMLYSPVGIIFIVAAKVVEVEYPELTFHRLLMYTITVLVGLLGHGFVILPLVYFLMTRKNPVIFMYGISQGIITALATSSSAATLPILLRCLERKNKVSSHVARFVAPVGAVINLNGSALYQAMACIFIAQHRSVDLTISQLALMSLIATLGSIGAKGIPQAGLITLVAVLTSVGLPQEDAVLILTVDWILDRVSTMVNVIGDAIGAGLISHLTAKEEARSRGFV